MRRHGLAKRAPHRMFSERVAGRANRVSNHIPISAITSTMEQPTAYKILIVDDDPFILDMYVLKFKEQGFTIEIARDGKEGITKNESFQPDIILLDAVMPIMDGFDMLKEIKKSPAHPVKTILLTNLGQKEDVDRGLALGADAYIIKAHFTPTEVVEKVKKLLSGHE